MSTQLQRDRFRPPCTQKGNLYVGAYQALDSVLRRYRYAPQYGVTGSYNCRRITGGRGYSLHAYGPGNRFTFWTGVSVTTALAVDINWDRNPYGSRLVTDMPRAMVEDILDIHANNGEHVWGWGGNWRQYKDAMHYEIVCSMGALQSGIAGATVPTPTPVPPAAPPGELNVDNLRLVRRGNDGWPVRVVQGLLNGGGVPCTIDGDFGPQTDGAVRTFQRAHGLAADGIVGPNTYRKLLGPILQ